MRGDTTPRRAAGGGCHVSCRTLSVVALLLMLVSAGCVSEEDRVYPTKLSSIEAREALGELTRSTNFAEVISRQPLPPRRKSEETAPRERTFPFVVEVVNGRKKVRLDIVKFLELAQANDITFLAYKESLASAEESLRATLRSYRPVFGGTVSASYDFKNDSESQGVNFSLSQKLPWNGSLKLATSADRSHYSSPPDRESMSLSTMLSLSLDIYLRPGGYAEWRESIIQAERNWVYSQRQFRRNRENYLINMVQLYYDTINARKSLESQNERLKKAQDAYDLVRFEYNRGRRTLTDVNVAEENLIDARQAIIDAKENYAELLDDLKLKLGIPQEYDIELVDEPLSVKPIGEIDMDEVIRKALANNPDYQTQRDRYEDRRRNFLLSLYRLRNVPHVNLSYSFPLVDESSEGYEEHNTDWSASILWSYNLDQESRKKQYRSLLQSWTIYVRDFKRQQESNVKEIRRRVRQLLNARRTLENAMRSYEAAVRKKEGAELEFDLGKIDSREMNDAINRVQSATDALNRARVSYKLAYLRFLSMLGELKIDEEGEWLK